MSVVHFGAGNIGRGFVGLLLDRAGHELVFADVADDLITALDEADSYEVHEVGNDPATHVVDGFRAVHSANEADVLVDEIAVADMVTTAVGAHVLVHLAPAIADGIAARSPDAATAGSAGMRERHQRHRHPAGPRRGGVGSGRPRRRPARRARSSPTRRSTGSCRTRNPVST